MAKKTTRQKLEEKADKEFSRYIRLRDRIGEENVKCITCNTIAPWKQVDCGHFQSRRHKITRWHEHNANAQCKRCNNWGAGEQFKHAKAIDIKFGKGKAEEIEQLSKTSYKYALWELEEIIEKYKKMADDLLKNKPLCN
jgi:hypothetical protein